MGEISPPHHRKVCALSTSEMSATIYTRKQAIKQQQNLLNRLVDFIDVLEETAKSLEKALLYCDDEDKKVAIRSLLVMIEAIASDDVELMKPSGLINESDIAKPFLIIPEAEAPKPRRPKQAKPAEVPATEPVANEAFSVICESEAPKPAAKQEEPVASIEVEAKPKKVKRFEPIPNMRRFVQTILCAKPLPTTFEEALELAFGKEEWKTRRHSVVGVGDSHAVGMPYAEEIYREKSQVKAQIRSSIDNVYAASRGEVPEGYVATEIMLNYVEMAKKRSYKTLNARLKQWGI